MPVGEGPGAGPRPGQPGRGCSAYIYMGCHTPPDAWGGRVAARELGHACMRRMGVHAANRCARTNVAEVSGWLADGRVQDQAPCARPACGPRSDGTGAMRVHQRMLPPAALCPRPNTTCLHRCGARTRTHLVGPTGTPAAATTGIRHGSSDRRCLRGARALMKGKHGTTVRVSASQHTASCCVGTRCGASGQAGVL